MFKFCLIQLFPVFLQNYCLKNHLLLISSSPQAQVRCQLCLCESQTTKLFRKVIIIATNTSHDYMQASISPLILLRVVLRYNSRKPNNVLNFLKYTLFVLQREFNKSGHSGIWCRGLISFQLFLAYHLIVPWWLLPSRH